MQHQGRLELTWTNKHLALLAPDDSGYEWVPQSDYRVAEVRLLEEVDQVGDSNLKNLLIHGDALNALQSLVNFPELAKKYVGKVRLVYLDPPFNTQQAFRQYDDALEHSVWLTMMRDRLSQIKTLLAKNGSVWIHCDDSEQHRLRSVADEVFGLDNFYATFIWRKVDSPNDNHVPVTTDHDYILCYAKSKKDVRFNPMPDESILKAYGSVAENGRPYRDRLLKKNGRNSLREDRPTMFFGVPDPDGNKVYPIHDDGREARWSYGEPAVFRMLEENKIVWKRRIVAGKEQWVPYTREWAPELPTRPWPTIWTDLDTMRQAKAHLRGLFPGITVFDTPKPESLLHRILEIATDPGDIVMDCFGGSGTTAAVAHKMEREWVLVERGLDVVETFIKPRLQSVVSGLDIGGVTESTSWSGGGGFRYLRVCPSMFETVLDRVVLADWATNGKLAKATAAQLGFEYEYRPPFCGIKGRTRLAVIDGVVNDDVIRLLTQALDNEEKLMICGTSIDSNARDILKQLRPGSTVKKIPEAILARYRKSFGTLFEAESEMVAQNQPDAESLPAVL